ncbi:putative ribonuclease H-like domain-containing protein [Tanacetum coccineum]
MPPKRDLILADENEYVFGESVTSVPDVATSEVNESKPKLISKPLIEDYISDSEDENETESKSKQIKSSFAKGNPQLELQEKRVIDSGCSRHMTGNKSYISNYKEIDCGFSVEYGKGIKREFSVARTPQQNGVAKRKNRTLIEVARTMLADSKKPALSFMRPFGCPVTILNTLDHLGNQTNGSAGTKESINAGQADKKIVSSQEYILLPLLTNPSLSKGLKDSPDAGFKPSGEEEKKDDEDPVNEEETRVNQEKDASVNRTNSINTVSSTVNVVGIEDNVVDENIVYGCEDDPNMPNLEEIVYSEDDEGVGVEADMSNLIIMDSRIFQLPDFTRIIHLNKSLETYIQHLKLEG